MRRLDVALLSLAALWCRAGFGTEPAQTDRLRLPDGIELAVAASDAIGNTEVRFVQGETIRISATISALDVLDAMARADRAEVTARAPQEGGAAGDVGASRQRVAEAKARVGPRLQELRGKLAVDVLTVGETSRQADVVPVKSGASEIVNGAREEVWWVFDGASTPAANLTFRVALADPPSEVRVSVDIVPVEAATQAERCRASYIGAHLAFEQGRVQEAAALAREAAGLGESRGYYTMAAFHVLGDAQSRLGDGAGALEAYRRALKIAEAAFPKSNLPDLLGRRIRELGGTTSAH
jgi:hypothetical protein